MINEADHSSLPLVDLFRELRDLGIPLGVEELGSALSAIQRGLGGTTVTELRELLKMIWLTSREEVRIFDPVFDLWLNARVQQSSRQSPPMKMQGGEGLEVGGARGDGGTILDTEAAAEGAVAVAEPPTEKSRKPARTSDEPARISLKLSGNQDFTAEPMPILRQHDPVSPLTARRLWQRLNVEDEVRNQYELDLPGTIRRIARHGYFDAPVMRPRRIRALNLVILMDRGGSMTPMHDFCDRWREALEQTVRFRRLQLAYFHDAVREEVYLDVHRNRSILLHRLLRPFPTRETAVLIITDAGAARQSWDPQRILQSERLANRLRRSGFIQLWLNPFRAEYWKGSGAEEVSHIVPKMVSMDAIGTREAVRYLNETLKHLDA